MKDNFQYIKQLENCRYPVTSEYNGTQVTYSIVTASPTWELVILNITYNELVEKLKAHFGIFPVLGTNEEGQGSIQSYRNHLSTLNSFLASVGKTLESRVGVELGSAFESSLKWLLLSAYHRHLAHEARPAHAPELDSPPPQGR